MNSKKDNKYASHSEVSSLQISNVDVTVRAYTGSDHDCIRKKLIEEITGRGAHIHFEQPQTPLEFELAVINDGQQSISKVDSETKLIIVIQLTATEFALHIHNVHFVIIDGHMSDMLPGRNLFYKSGFNFQNNLTKVGKHIHKMTVDEVQQIKLATLIYGIHHGTHQGYPIELSDHLKSSFGVDSPELISTAFEKMNSEVQTNGMIKKRLGKTFSSLRKTQERVPYQTRTPSSS